MALDRKDIKASRLTRLDPDDHERLKIICERDDMDISEWVEQLILREIKKRWDEAREASSLNERLERVGIARKHLESAGTRGARR